jgi:hypothetical protein
MNKTQIHKAGGRGLVAGTNLGSGPQSTRLACSLAVSSDRLQEVSLEILEPSLCGVEGEHKVTKVGGCG